MVSAAVLITFITLLTRKLFSIDDLAYVLLTAFRTETLTPSLTITLSYDLDLQSYESCGHDPYTSKRSRSKVTRFKR